MNKLFKKNEKDYSDIKGLNTVCRGFNNRIEYILTPIQLNIEVDSDPVNKTGKISGYELYINGTLRKGSSKEELDASLEALRKIYNLRKIKDNARKSIIIWTNNIRKIEGFYYSRITNLAKRLYIEVDEVFEFRDLKIWNEELSYEPVSKWTDYIWYELYQKIFIPHKYFYVSPNQIVRKHIRKNCPKEWKDVFIKRMFPRTFGEWEYLRYALYGGLTACLYPTVELNYPIVDFDLHAAYIYSLLACKHVSGKGKRVPLNTWRSYLGKEDVGTIGQYKITFRDPSPLVRCYKDVEGNSPSAGTQTKTFVMNNIDLKLFLTFVKEIEVKCIDLTEYPLDYLPEWLRNSIIEEYVKERNLPRGTEDRRLQKVMVRGIYGDCIKKLETETEFINERKETVLIPHYGIWTTSYTKKYLFEAAKNIEKWLYSDTDSIYCKDTKANRDIIEKFNSARRAQLFKVCHLLNMDFDSLVGLGEFKEEYKITRFKANAIKEYMFTTNKGEFILKAAGFSQRYETIDEKMFELDEIPVGKMLFTRPGHDNYYEFWLEGEQARLLIEATDKIEDFADSI